MNWLLCARSSNLSQIRCCRSLAPITDILSFNPSLFPQAHTLTTIVLLLLTLTYSFQRQGKVQVLAKARKGRSKSSYSPKALPTVPQDKAHCLPPLAWANGKCVNSPRGAKDTPAAEGKACGVDEHSAACKEFRKNEVHGLLLTAGKFSAPCEL